jgi:integrase
MHNDRYIPLHPEVKQLLDEWVSQSPPKKPYDFLFTGHGYRLGRGKVALSVERIGKEAGIKEHIYHLIGFAIPWPPWQSTVECL